MSIEKATHSGLKQPCYKKLIECKINTINNILGDEHDCRAIVTSSPFHVLVQHLTL